MPQPPPSPSGAPHVGFVLERSLGHVTHAENLKRLLPVQDGIEAVIAEIPWDTEGWASRVPGFSTNWTVRSGLRARRAIRRLRRSGHLDALFVHTQVPAVLSQDHFRHVPTVVSLDATPLQYDELGAAYGHARSGDRAEGLKWRLNRGALRRARHVVAWSTWTKQGVVDGYGIDAADVTVVPPGVDVALWHHDRGVAADDAPVRILFVGGDLARKGGDVLLDAFRDVRAGLAAAGDDPDRVELHLVTKSAVEPVPGVVVHAGLGPNSPELVALYRRSDVFCLPSAGDCLPMVLSEAGAASLPLVSTPVAAIPEIVRDGDTGLIVPVGDRAALASALRSLVADPQLRARLGAGANALVHRDYNAADNVAKLAEVLRAVAAGGAGRP